MVADPTSADTAPETLRALRTHGLLPVLVHELTEPTPYGPDGDEGDSGDADLEEKLTRSRIKTPPLFDSFQTAISVLLMINSDVFFFFAGCCARMCLRMAGRLMVRKRCHSECSWNLGRLQVARAPGSAWTSCRR